MLPKIEVLLVNRALLQAWSIERLWGDRAGQFSIRINDQYRICFRWENGHADDVEVTDYH